MKNQINHLLLALAGSLSALNPQLFGGTVITNNLPANTAIINISGTRTGRRVIMAISLLV